MRLISASVRPPDAWMRIDCSLPVALSLAETLSIPLASMSKVTSTCGTPRGAGLMFSSRNRPRTRLSAARSRSPCKTTTSTAVWLSSAVLNTSVRRAGIVVFRSITLVITPPSVSIPSDSGVTSSSRTSLTSPFSTAAWTAAPSATTSSGLTDMFGSLPPVRRRTRFCTAGILGAPPTRMTSSRSFSVSLGSSIACLNGPIVRSTPSAGSWSHVASMRVEFRAVGAVAGDERQAHGGLRHGGQLYLCLLGCLEETLQCLRVGAQVDAVVTLELIGQVVHDAPVEVVAAQVRVSRRRAHLDDALSDIKKAHIEGPAAQVEDENGLVLLLVQA